MAKIVGAISVFSVSGRSETWTNVKKVVKLKQRAEQDLTILLKKSDLVVGLV